MNQAQAERKRELFRLRTDLARKAVLDYRQRKFKDAATAFHNYLRILEEWKGVQEHGLTPAHFDNTEEPELLLVSGVYWDLAKLYDRTVSADKKRECILYLKKFVQFSKGTPHEAMAAETMRKYIANEKPKYRQDFKNAYKALGGSDCFVMGALGDLIEADSIEGLRRFRDQVLEPMPGGRWVVSKYYEVGPVLASRVKGWPVWRRRLLARLAGFVGRGLYRVI